MIDNSKFGWKYARVAAENGTEKYANNELNKVKNQIFSAKNIAYVGLFGRFTENQIIMKRVSDMQHSVALIFFRSTARYYWKSPARIYSMNIWNGKLPAYCSIYYIYYICYSFISN